MIVNLLHHLDWDRGCRRAGKTLSTCVCDGVSGRDQRLNRGMSKADPSPVQAGVPQSTRARVEQKDRGREDRLSS